MTQMTQSNLPTPQPMPARQAGQPAPMQPYPAPVAPGAAAPRPIAAPYPAPVPAQPGMPSQPVMPAPAYPPAQTAPAVNPMVPPSPQPGNILDYAGQQTPHHGMPNLTNQPMEQVSAAQTYAPLDEGGKESGEKPLPSVSIHAFCDRQETAHCVNETTRDWRMKRTNVKIYMGGLPAAIEFYRKENTPSLIVFESGMRGQELFNQLDQLASVCDEGTRVVMIGATNDIRLYRQLMVKGVSDYLVPPLHPLHLIRSLGELYADPEQPIYWPRHSVLWCKRWCRILDVST